LQLKQDNSKMENFNIIEEKSNPLFKRKEVQFSIEAEVTPSNSEVEKLISEKFSTQEENIKIKKIEGKFGSKVFKVNANIYNSKQDKEDTEPKQKKKGAEKPAEGEVKSVEQPSKEESEKKEKEKTEEEKQNNPS